jgi:hypothetical protein
MVEETVVFIVRLEHTAGFIISAFENKILG